MTTVPFFETERLAAQFRQALDHAQQRLQLSLAEAQWLTDAQAAQLPADMRVEWVLNAQPLTTAGLIIGNTDPLRPAVYLFSPLHGLQIHPSRQALEIALLASPRHLGIAADPLQFQTLEEAVFDQWSIIHVREQTTGLQRTLQRLEALPTLQTTLERCLQTAFSGLLGSEPAAGQHPVQKLDDQAKVVGCTTLIAVALGMLCNESLGAGRSLRYLDSATLPVALADQAPWHQALVAGVGALPEAWLRALDAYWDGEEDEAVRNRREELILALADDFARALLHAHAAEVIDDTHLETLKTLLWPSENLAQPATSLLQFSTGEGATVPLGGTLVLQTSPSAHAPLFIYSAATGIHRFANEAALLGFYAERIKQGSRPAGITQQHWQLLQASTQVRTQCQPITQKSFTALADAVILQLALGSVTVLRSPAAQTSTTLARLDDAMDIRALIDRRLPLIATQGRWAPGRFAHPDVHLPQVPDVAKDMESRLRQLNLLQQRLQALTDARPDVDACIEHLLAADIAVISEGRLRPADLYVHHDGLSVSLNEFFLKRLAGVGLGQIMVGVSLEDAHGNTLDWPDAAWLLERVDQRKAEFSRVYASHLADYDRGSVRLGEGVWEIASEYQAAYETLLRADLAQTDQLKQIDTGTRGLLQNWLDRTPSAESTLYGLYVNVPDAAELVQLSNAVVLVDPRRPASRAILWTALAGVQVFATLQQLRDLLDLSLTLAADRAHWAELMAPSQATEWLRRRQATTPTDAVTTDATIEFKVIKQGLIAYVYDTERVRAAQARSTNLTVAIRCRFAPLLFRTFAKGPAGRELLNAAVLDLMERVANSRFADHLPTWLKNADATDLWIFQQLLESCARVATPEAFYLSGVPEMEDFARPLLKAALQHDDPAYPSDPDQLIITLRQYVGSPPLIGATPSGIPAVTTTVSKTLTAFSLSHFSELSTGTMSVSAAPGAIAAKLPEPLYLRKLIDRLDIARAYRAMLATVFKPDDRDYLKRRKLFSLALPPNLLSAAFEGQLQGSLSGKAVEYLLSILMAPDASARPLVDGKRIEFGQLQFKAAANLAADRVAGMYLCGPSGAQDGPLLLYTAYSPDNAMREFKNEAALLAAVQQEKPLQALLVGRIARNARSRYAHNGFLHPHIVWSSSDPYDFATEPPPVQLQRPAILGNALHHLFEENLATLLDMAQTRTVTTAEADWRAYCYLMTLGLEQSTLLLPGELNVLVNAWQSGDWLKSAVHAASERNWGQALGEFAAAIGSLATSRSAKAQGGALETAPVKETTQVLTGERLLLQQSEAGPQRELQRYEAGDVELNRMVHDPVRQVYTDPDSQWVYAVVEGRVVQIRQFGGQWHLVKDADQGPQVVLQNDGQWKYRLGLRGGGGNIISLMTRSAVNAELDQIFIIQASGMQAIKNHHFADFCAIGQAHGRAVELLTTGLANLNAARPWEPLPQAVEGILHRTFGGAPSAHTVSRLRNDCQTLLGEMLSQAMNPRTSARMVKGLNKPGREFHIAFTLVDDPLKRIFLSEVFFKVRDDVRANTLVRDAELLEHHQAVTLIHEVSHHALRTTDMAYVDAAAPHLDQLERTTQGNQEFYNSIADYRHNGFSITTPRARLFTTFDGATWRDFSTRDGRPKATILDLSGCATLDEARTVFLTDAEKRGDLIMRNADSLALLISELGRTRYASYDGG